MNQKYLSRIGLVLFFLILLFSLSLSLRAFADTLPPPQTETTPTNKLLFNTIITVTTTVDEGTDSETCSGNPCTLRRAVVQARNATKPVLIAFDIPITDTNYDALNQVWILDVDSSKTNEARTAFRRFDTTEITIDGFTQPTGRPFSEGPRIFIRGDDWKGAFNLSGSGGTHVIRGLGFQAFGDSVLIVGGDDNLVEDNWFGLTVDGMEMYPRNPSALSDGSGSAGIEVLNNTTGNIVRRNALMGFKAAAIDVEADMTQIISNTVGTRADGTVPAVRPERKCKPNARYYNWFGGTGITVGGESNTVEQNRIVGMLIFGNSPTSTQEDALELSGDNHSVRYNIVGRDSAGQDFGTCGGGIDISDSKFTQLVTNTLIGVRGGPAIFIGGTGNTMDAITVQGNIIDDASKELLKFGDLVPSALKNFNPAEVTNIAGTSVSGTAGASSPCANCIIDLYLDIIDPYTATSQLLARTTADGSGNWSATLTRTLALTEAIRTNSTIVADEQISGFSAGTTSKFSEPYTQPGAPTPGDPPPFIPQPPLPITPTVYLDPPTPIPALSYTTIITVTSAGDPNDSQSETCANTSPCTLRRAIEQASALSPAERPVLIHFSLSTTDSFDSNLNVWTIQLYQTNQNEALPRVEGGQVVIDGENVLPGGRNLSQGPHIIIRGPESPLRNGMVFDGDGNEVRNLAFQNFNQFLTLNHSQNIVEDNWFGLSADGMDIELRTTGDPNDGSGTGGIRFSSGGSLNLLQNNAFVGFKGKAINLDSDDSFVRANTVGTRFDGTVPDVSATRKCKPNGRYNNWFAGAGIKVVGERNQVGGPDPAHGNRIVGLLFGSESPLSTPDNAIDVTGSDHLVQNNIIGLTSTDDDFGTCGRGIVIGSDFTRVVSNTIVNAWIEGIGVYGTQININAVTFSDNIIKNNQAVDPNSPEELNNNAAIVFGPTVPEVLRVFTPSQIITFTNSLLAGSNGEDASCPYCRLELFVDDLNPITESLEYLGATTTTVDGKWSFNLAQPLALTQGVRIVNTTLNYGTIKDFESGTSSRLSDVYSQTGAVYIPGPPTPPLQPPDPIPGPSIPPLPTPPINFNTIITVTSTTDPDGSQSTTCYATPGVGQSIGSPCTLRRAIVEASSHLTSARPILIKFELDDTDPNYDSTLQAWTIQLEHLAQNDALPRLKGGQVVIDGSTPATGRTDGPKIILRGPDDISGRNLIIDDDNNVIRGIAFQNHRFHLTFNGSSNIIEDNWFGLSDDGQDVAFNSPNPSDGSGQSGVETAANERYNLFQNNALAGLTGSAISARGDYATIISNYVGTRSDGSVPYVPEHRKCKPNARYDNWFGGTGINVSGAFSRVGGPNPADGNIIIGLLLYSNSPIGTQDDAIAITGPNDNLAQNNRIGLDINGQKFGTCNSGIKIESTYSHLLDNIIAHPFAPAIQIDGTLPSMNAVTVNGNILTDSVEAVAFGQLVPSQLSTFTPSQVINFNGVNLSGTNFDPNSECPYCRLEVFADDLDPDVEALQSLGVVTTDINSDWSLTLNQALPLTMGVRTQNTTLDYNTIASFEAGTSSRLYELYPQPGAPGYTPPPAPPIPTPPVIPAVEYLDPPEAPTTFATIITVTTTDDSATSQTCADTTPDNCSLRRAINEASDLAENERPVLIAFDIPGGDSGYDGVNDLWKITLNSNLPVAEGGRIVIDGSTQPTGRSAGPKIVLRYNSTTGNVKLALGSTAQESYNIVRGLGFQGVELSYTGKGNIIEDNWLGLSDDGLSIFFPGDDVSKDNKAIIDGASGGDNNLIRNNALAGSRTDAMNLQSDDNLVYSNTIGLNALGTIPPFSATVCDQTDTSDNWFGGGNLYLAGERNRIMYNTIAGLLIQGSSTSTPDDGIDMTNGLDNLLLGNQLGTDINGGPLWLCGNGIQSGANYTRMLSNTVVNPYGGVGIFVNGDIEFINANVMQGNIFSGTVKGIQFGPAVPAQLVNFNPALITVISGTSVSGISDDDCPYCRVDVYLDNEDGNHEALAYLGSDITNVNGNWSLTLPAPLNEGECLRTISSARDYGVVTEFEAETSSQLSSTCFTQQPPAAPASVAITGPSVLTQSVAGVFVATVSPATTTLPISYTWEAQGQSTVNDSGGVQNDVTWSWDSLGMKQLTVTVENAYGTQSANFSVDVVTKPSLSPMQSVSISGPTSGEPNTVYNFTANVSPSNVATPIDYTWTATDLGPTNQPGGGLSDGIALTWTLTGTKNITVSATNLSNTVTSVYTVNISVDGGSSNVYLPLVVK